MVAHDDGHHGGDQRDPGPRPGDGVGLPARVPAQDVEESGQQDRDRGLADRAHEGKERADLRARQLGHGLHRVSHAPRAGLRPSSRRIRGRGCARSGEAPGLQQAQRDGRSAAALAVHHAPAIPGAPRRGGRAIRPGGCEGRREGGPRPIRRHCARRGLRHRPRRWIAATSARVACGVDSSAPSRASQVSITPAPKNPPIRSRPIIARSRAAASIATSSRSSATR